MVSVVGNFRLSGFAAEEPCSKTIIKEVGLGENLTSEFNDEIDRNDLCLHEGSVNVQGDDSDTREVLVLGQRGRFIGPTTALIGSQEYDDAVLEINGGTIKFYYVFDNSIDLTKVSLDSPLEINFLGRAWSITGVTNSSFSAISGDLYLLRIGDQLIYNGKAVQVLRVSQSGAIVVDVDGVTEVLSRSQTKSINGLEVTNRESFYDSSNLFNNFADVAVGVKTFVSAKAGQPYPGQNYSGWVWNIGGLASATSTSTSSASEFTGPYIGVENNFEFNSEDAQLKAGSCVGLPNNYVVICFDRLTEEDYVSLAVDVETADLSAAGGGGSESTTHFTASGNGLRVSGTRTKEAWVTSDGRIYYERNGVQSAGISTTIGSVEDLTITNAAGTFTIASPRQADNIMFSFSGSSLGTATWNGVNVINKDGRLITRQGVVVKAGNRLKLLVPKDQIKAVMNITSLSN
ncbi:MAG: hypothetical protein HYT16_00725 [DPANN group archaeon]|nr:hypothetical protein [DPANN group archaeon]